MTAEAEGLSWGDALEIVKRGGLVKRRVQTDDAFVFMTVAKTFGHVPGQLARRKITVTPMLCYATGDWLITGWSPTLLDQLALDWERVEDKTSAILVVPGAAIATPKGDG